MVARGSGHLCSCPRCPARPASPAQFGLRGDEVRAARVRPGAARGPRAEGVGVSVVLPGLHPRRRACSPTPAEAAAVRRHEARRRTSPRAVVKAIEHDRAELDVAPLALRAGATLAGLAPGARRHSPAPARRDRRPPPHRPRPARQALGRRRRDRRAPARRSVRVQSALSEQATPAVAGHAPGGGFRRRPRAAAPAPRSPVCRKRAGGGRRRAHGAPAATSIVRRSAAGMYAPFAYRRS